MTRADYCSLVVLNWRHTGEVDYRAQDQQDFAGEARPDGDEHDDVEHTPITTATISAANLLPNGQHDDDGDERRVVGCPR